MTKNSIAVIVTVLNEAKTVELLVASLAKQTRLPDEVIISDGGSSDGTLELLTQLQEEYHQLNLKIVSAPGNRSVGRNQAIQKALSSWIAITDAGCVADKNWLFELEQAAQHNAADVVAGYYRGQAQTPLQAAIIPYVLVMPNKVNPNNFLPATRSMLLTKKAWEAVGGFDVRLGDNEDYAFAHALAKQPNVTMTFTDKAIVTWLPPQTLKQFSTMIFRFSRGDISAQLFRPKVAFIFGRYFMGLLIIGLGFFHSVYWLWLLGAGFAFYSLWAIRKNYRYTNHFKQAWLWLPILQIVSDIAVLYGSLSGAYHLISQPASKVGYRPTPN